MTHPNNTAPEGFREVTEHEFSKVFGHNAIKGKQEYKQLLADSDGNKFPQMLPVYLFEFYDGTGVGIESVSSYSWQNKKQEYSIRYYAFGCDHKYTELSQATCRERGISHYGMFCHVYECETCGRIEQVDSSG